MRRPSVSPIIHTQTQMHVHTNTPEGCSARQCCFHMHQVYVRVLCRLPYKLFMDSIKLAEVWLQTVSLSVFLCTMHDLFSFFSICFFFFFIVFYGFFFSLAMELLHSQSWERKKSIWVCQPLPFSIFLVAIASCVFVCMTVAAVFLPYEARFASGVLPHQ